MVFFRFCWYWWDINGNIIEVDALSLAMFYHMKHLSHSLRTICLQSQVYFPQGLILPSLSQFFRDGRRHRKSKERSQAKSNVKSDFPCWKAILLAEGEVVCKDLSIFSTWIGLTNLYKSKSYELNNPLNRNRSEINIVSMSLTLHKEQIHHEITIPIS